MEEQDKLIKWKSDAWKDRAMVAWYAQRMAQNVGTNMLKNRIEVDLILQQATGQRVIDIGVGTGRAALPLLRRGAQLTAIDSSQEMLDETQCQAGNLPIDTRVGDISRLPVDAATFDCATSLNVLVHFPNWREALQEWQRVLKPGGRIVFDIHSLDHLRATLPDDAAVQQAIMGDVGGSREFSSFISTLTVAELVACADELGLTVVNVAPYGAFVAGAHNYWLRANLESTFRWQRTLSWLQEDPRLFELALFIDQQFIQRLGSATTNRLMITLENRRDNAANQQLLQRHQALNQIGDTQIRLDRYLPLLPIDAATFRQQLDRMLLHPRNSVFLYEVFRTLGGFDRIDCGSLLPERWLRLFEDWALQDSLDNMTMALASNWSAGLPSGDRLEFAGVSLGASLEYRLTEDILTTCFGVFSGAHK